MNFLCLRLSYHGLALRHVIKGYKLQNFMLGCVLYDAESQSATNIRTFVDSQLLSFGVTLNDLIFVVTDNENKLPSAFKEKYTCIGYSIHRRNKQLEYCFVSNEIDRRKVNCKNVRQIS